MAKTEILNHCHYDDEIARIQFMICDKKLQNKTMKRVAITHYLKKLGAIIYVCTHWLHAKYVINFMYFYCF